jgi:hypothetical protein
MHRPMKLNIQGRALMTTFEDDVAEVAADDATIVLPALCVQV